VISTGIPVEIKSITACEGSGAFPLPEDVRKECAFRSFFGFYSLFAKFAPYFYLDLVNDTRSQ